MYLKKTTVLLYLQIQIKMNKYTSLYTRVFNSLYSIHYIHYSE